IEMFLEAGGLTHNNRRSCMISCRIDWAAFSISCRSPSDHFTRATNPRPFFRDSYPLEILRCRSRKALSHEAKGVDREFEIDLPTELSLIRSVRHCSRTKASDFNASARRESSSFASL